MGGKPGNLLKIVEAVTISDGWQSFRPKENL